ncbi:MAG: hypothetical protein AAF310_01100 [Myxococcota bacterium]
MSDPIEVGAQDAVSLSGDLQGEEGGFEESLRPRTPTFIRFILSKKIYLLQALYSN